VVIVVVNAQCCDKPVQAIYMCPFRSVEERSTMSMELWVERLSLTRCGLTYGKLGAQ
jgi:hypothetical protein